MMKVVRCISLKVDQEGTALEGCRCHAHFLHEQGYTYSERVRRYRVNSKGCHNKGKHAAILAAGGTELILDNIQNATDRSLRKKLVCASPKQRAHMHGFGH